MADSLIPALVPETLEYYAALLESVQAQQDFADAWQAYRATGHMTLGSPEDYAMFRASAYASAAERVVRDTPVWQSQTGPTPFVLTDWEVLQSAREWVADCLSYPDAGVIDDARVRRYIDAHYPGRWDAFQRHMRMGTQYPVIPQ